MIEVSPSIGFNRTTSAQNEIFAAVVLLNFVAEKLLETKTAHETVRKYNLAENKPKY